MSVPSVAVIQAAFTDDAQANVSLACDLVRQAADAGANIVLLPELFQGLYFPQRQLEANFDLAQVASGNPVIQKFAALAQQLAVVLPVSFFERSSRACYNSVAVLDADGSVLGIYRKSHIPAGPGYQEKYYFRPGDTGFCAWQTRYATIGVGICWDQWFPEAALAMVLAGADLLLYPTAIGSEPAEPELDSRAPWRRAMIGHAVANVVAVAAANRTGTEDEIEFYGSSFVADHRGDVVAELGKSDTGFACAPIDLDRMRRSRDGWGFFRDRRPDLYGSLIK